MLPHVIEARDCLAKYKCVPGGDGVRPQRIAGVSDDACGIFRRSMMLFVGDLSLNQQPIGWSMSRVSLLLKDRTRDRVAQLRPVGAVSTTQRWGATTETRQHSVEARINTYAYRKGVGFD